MEKITTQKFLEFIIKNMVTYPDDVVINQSMDEMGVLLTVDVNKQDIAKIIGKQGQIVNAIRSILRVVAYNNNSRVTLKINEPK